MSEAPSNPSPPRAGSDDLTITRVIAAVIEQGGRYLIAQRPTEKRHGGRWEFPGGKLHDGETLHDGATRELWEELRVRVERVGKPLLVVRDPGSAFQIEFTPTAIVGEPVALEHLALAWATARELLRFDLAPSDDAFARSLQPPR